MLNYNLNQHQTANHVNDLTFTISLYICYSLQLFCVSFYTAYVSYRQAAGPQHDCFFKINFPVGSMWNEDFNPMLYILMICARLSKICDFWITSTFNWLYVYDIYLTLFMCFLVNMEAERRNKHASWNIDREPGFKLFHS